jgi:abortive infection bacteriophage resistance protein
MKEYKKKPLTYSEQVDLLVSRGLTIEDRAEAEKFLSQVNYYRFSAYRLPFEIREHQFKPGTTFEQIRALYDFDRCLRFLIDEALELVEIYIRSLTAHQLSHTYHAFAHEDPVCFFTGFDHADWIAKVHAETERSKETFVEHYKANYQDFPKLPIWMAVETMSFGALSQLYQHGLKKKDQIDIAAAVSLHNNVFYSWLHTFAYVRNCCAHHSRLWNRKLAIPMVLPRKPDWVGIEPSRIACVIFALEYVLSKLPSGKVTALTWHEEIIGHLSKAIVVNKFYESMGFPSSFKEHKLFVLNYNKGTT